MQLSEDFLRETRSVMGPDRFERYLQAFEEESPVSIRINPQRISSEFRLLSSKSIVGHTPVPSNDDYSVVPWCPYGFYLPTRPPFTFDPLLHAGCFSNPFVIVFSPEATQRTGDQRRMLRLCAPYLSPPVKIKTPRGRKTSGRSNTAVPPEFRFS